VADVAHGRPTGSASSQDGSPFVPAGEQPIAQLVGEFDRLQAAQLSCLAAADGLPLGRLWIRSPFDRRIRYNVFSCLTILPRHQQRHLWQAEQVWEHSRRI